jgi:hypothetical protein
MDNNLSQELKFSSTITTNKEQNMNTGFKNIYKFECYDASGNLKWTEEVQNLVVNEGLDDILNQYYKGSTYTAAHYVGLTDGTPTIAATDTAGSHAGWVEDTNYAEATRPSLTLGTVSSQSVDNSASKATFSINATTTIGGAFVITNNTKGGTTGTLVGAAAFTAGDKSVANGDTLNVTVTLSASSV